MEEKNKEGTGEYHPELDTDAFEMSTTDGLVCDRRGELVLLLPEPGRTEARQRGWAAQLVSEGDVAHVAVEKGSEFSGTVREEEGLRPADMAQEAQEGEPEVPGAYKPGEIPGRVLEVHADSDKPSVLDFDLDFGLPGKEQPKPRVSEAPDEKRPKTAPAAQAPPQAAHVEQEPSGSEAPLIIEGPIPGTRPKTEAPAQPRPPRMEAGFYLEGGSVVKKPKLGPGVPGVKKKKKMKLPRQVREGRRASPLLVALIIALSLVLVGILSVLFVPGAREYYDRLAGNVPGEPKTEQPDFQPGAGEGHLPTIAVGPVRVAVPKGTDIAALQAYTTDLRRVLSQGSLAAARRVKKSEDKQD